MASLVVESRRIGWMMSAGNNIKTSGVDCSHVIAINIVATVVVIRVVLV